MPPSSDQRFQHAADELARLPPPDVDAQALSEKLITLIRDDIAAAGGRISFARYMELALYAPGLGYYSAGSRKFGEAGDFVTAPELSPLFSQCLARQIAEVNDAIAGGAVLEVGAGSGIMAADILAELERMECLPAHYLILERSAELHARQRDTLASRVPHLLERVQWLDELPTRGFRGVVVANELLDAMPVHLFEVGSTGAMERGVVWVNDHFQWDVAAPDDMSPPLAARLNMLASSLPDGYQSEINLAAEAWIKSAADVLETGALLLIDYGYSQHEYYLPERNAGTLMCHYRHRAHEDPFVYPGLQDITAHVDFTAMAEAGHSAGLTVKGYTTQACFLLSCGITELAERVMQDRTDPRQQILLAQQIRSLTLPGEMGERFKVMALTHDVDIPLRGFAMQDLRRSL
ncbi:MAG: SAM-dependent methyltransferase [Gammaproteobacteria bacterium]|nr:SAM-dependent methyltransferase [Gammaproteobacteria bacterium]